MISIIIPAYNEESRIESTLRDYTETLKGREFEIIVVCDGSRDRTAEIARKYAKVLEFGERLGKGGGVIEGFKAAKGDVVGYTDADSSLKADQYAKLLDELQKRKACCVIADRKSKEAMIIESQYLMRRFASGAFNLLFPRLMFGLNVRDSQCGGKIFTREYIDKVLPKLKCKGFEFDVELLWRVKKAGCRIVEIPVVWTDDKGSKFSFKYIPSMFVSLMKLRLGL